MSTSALTLCHGWSVRHSATREPFDVLSASPIEKWEQNTLQWLTRPIAQSRLTTLHRYALSMLEGECIPDAQFYALWTTDEDDSGIVVLPSEYEATVVTALKIMARRFILQEDGASFTPDISPQLTLVQQHVLAVFNEFQNLLGEQQYQEEDEIALVMFKIARTLESRHLPAHIPVTISQAQLDRTWWMSKLVVAIHRILPTFSINLAPVSFAPTSPPSTPSLTHPVAAATVTQIPTSAHDGLGGQQDHNYIPEDGTILDDAQLNTLTRADVKRGPITSEEEHLSLLSLPERRKKRRLNRTLNYFGPTDEGDDDLSITGMWQQREAEPEMQVRIREGDQRVHDFMERWKARLDRIIGNDTLD